LLITAIDFNQPPNGVALANHAAIHHNGTSYLFLGARELRRHVTNRGPFLAMPIGVAQVVETVAELRVRPVN